MAKKKSPVWTKRCSSCPDENWRVYIPNEYDICDNCLIRKYKQGESYKAGPGCMCCDSGEYGWTDEQVARFLRRALRNE